MRMQKHLDGSEEPEHYPSAASLIASVIGNGLKPCEEVIQAWMLHPLVKKFIADASRIDDEQKISILYCRHLDEMQAFETFSRARRDVANAEPFIFSTNWYQQYLQSQHWKDLKAESRQYFGNNCCACGQLQSPQDPLELHHRNYDSLGCESLQDDLSLFCHKCHTRNQPFVLSHLPSQEPALVARIRKLESLPGVYS